MKEKQKEVSGSESRQDAAVSTSSLSGLKVMEIKPLPMRERKSKLISIVQYMYSTKKAKGYTTEHIKEMAKYFVSYYINQTVDVKWDDEVALRAKFLAAFSEIRNNGPSSWKKFDDQALISALKHHSVNALKFINIKAPE